MEASVKGGAQAAAEVRIPADAQALADIEGSDEAVEVETGLITRPSFATARPAEQVFEGRINLPWLQIVHGVGKLSKAGFVPGDLVLGTEHHLYSPPRAAGKNQETPPLRVVIVNFTQYFKEYLSKEAQASGAKPRIFTTAAEAVAAGLTVEWNNATKSPPTAPKAMTWLVLIEKPEGCMCDLFCLEDPVDSLRYAPAYISLDKGAYLSVRDAFGMAANFTCKERGIDTAVWQMTTKIRRSATGNEVWVPAVRVIEHLKDDKVSRLRALVNR